MSTSKTTHRFIFQSNIHIYILCSLLVILFYYSLTIPVKYVGFLSDDAVYLLMADIYSPWFNNLKPVHGFLIEHNRFPPLYPLTLALLGGYSENAALASNITIALWCIGFFVTGLWLYQATRSTNKTILMVLTCSFTPSIILMTQELWSESLYFFLSYLFLYVLAISKKESVAFTILCGLLVCLVLLSRSIGLALCLAFLIYLIINRPKYWQASLLLVSVFYIAASFSQQFNSTATSYTAELLSFISNVKIDQYASLITVRLQTFWQSWCWLFTLGHESNISGLTRFALATMLLLTCSGFVLRLQQKKIDAIYLLIYTVIIMLWPYTDLHFQARFHAPLLPIYLFYIYSGTEFLFSYLKYKQYFQIIIAVLFIYIITPASLKIIDRAYTPVAKQLEPYSRNREWLLADNSAYGKELLVEQHRTVQVLQGLSQEISINECLYAIQAPLVMLHSKRITGVYPNEAIHDMESFIQTSTCPYFLAVNMIDHRGDFPPLFPCKQNLDNNDLYTRRFYVEANKQSHLHMCLIKLNF